MELIRADIHQNICGRHCVKLFFSIYDLLGRVRAATHTHTIKYQRSGRFWTLLSCFHTWLDCLVQTHGSVCILYHSSSHVYLCISPSLYSSALSSEISIGRYTVTTDMLYTFYVSSLLYLPLVLFECRSKKSIIIFIFLCQLNEYYILVL